MRLDKFNDVELEMMRLGAAGEFQKELNAEIQRRTEIDKIQRKFELFDDGELKIICYRLNGDYQTQPENKLRGEISTELDRRATRSSRVESPDIEKEKS